MGWILSEYQDAMAKLAEKYIDPNLPEFEYSHVLKSGLPNYPQYNEYLKRLAQHSYEQDPEGALIAASSHVIPKTAEAPGEIFPSRRFPGVRNEPTSLDLILKDIPKSEKEAIHYQNITPIHTRDLERNQFEELMKMAHPEQLQNLRSTQIYPGRDAEGELKELIKYQQQMNQEITPQWTGDVKLDPYLESYGSTDYPTGTINMNVGGVLDPSTLFHEMLHRRENLQYESPPENIDTVYFNEPKTIPWMQDLFSTGKPREPHLETTMRRPIGLPTDWLKLGIEGPHEEYLPTGTRAEMFNRLKAAMEKK